MHGPGPKPGASAGLATHVGDATHATQYVLLKNSRTFAPWEMANCSQAAKSPPLVDGKVLNTSGEMKE